MSFFSAIEIQIRRYKENGLSMFTSSSFQTHSTVLLHILSRIDNTIPVYFLQTGFHFPETILYKEEIAKRFNLQVIDIHSNTPKIRQMNLEGRFLFTSDPDYCCYLNKIQPMEPLLEHLDIWINGVRADQNANRANFQLEEKTNKKAIRYHPMLDWSQKMIFDYLREHNIPSHPLDAKGYTSIGCEPCTRKFDINLIHDERTARWFGMHKTECGLHTELISK